MRQRLVLSGLMAALLAAGVVSPTQAIHNGERAEFRSFDYMVSVRLAGHPDQHQCGGTLVAADVVLTAGHCLGRNPKRQTVIVSTDKPGWRKARKVPVAGFRMPPHFSIDKNNRNDIALLRLAKPQSSALVGLADAEPKSGTRVITAGWGCTGDPPKCGGHPGHLQMTVERVVSDSHCDRSTFFNPPAHEKTSICARGKNTVASFGDSGGPLLVGSPQSGFTQVGVASLLTDKRGETLNAYTSVPVLSGWIARATAALTRTGP